MKNKIYLSFALLLASIISYSQPGALDPSFNMNGKVTTAIGLGVDDGRAIAVQSDGKIVVAGYSHNGTKNDFALARYNTNGLLDGSFDPVGLDGIVTTSIGTIDDVGLAIAIQNDGKIVLAGYSFNGIDNDFAIVRYNTNGSLDGSFDPIGLDGIVITDIGSDDYGRSVALQSDGKIVVVGYSGNGANDDFALVRYNTNGSLDGSFDPVGGDGIVTTPIGPGVDNARSLALQSDGKIVMVGFSSNGTNEDFALARYNTNGSLDGSFDPVGLDGIVTTPIGPGNDAANSVALQSDGKIVVAGRSFTGTNDDFALARYNTNGSLDGSFDPVGLDGIVTTPIGTGIDNARAVALQSDGKIVAAGFSFNATDEDFALARYNPDGSLDMSFGGGGKVVTDFVISSVDVGLSLKLSGLRIYVAGFSNDDFAVAAYLNDAFPLPLSLTSFTASKKNSSIQLNWQTANEQNTASFEIERSTDGRSFTNLGTVKASGNSSSTRNYSFTDRQPLTGTNFYRLKMVDMDGPFTYSKVVAVTMNAITKGLQIFPNPVTDLLHVQATGNETATLQITDAAGRIVKQEKIQLNGNTSFSVEVLSLSKGKYYFVLQRKQGKEVQSFVKQ